MWLYRMCFELTGKRESIRQLCYATRFFSISKISQGAFAKSTLIITMTQVNQDISLWELTWLFKSIFNRWSLLSCLCSSHVPPSLIRTFFLYTWLAVFRVSCQKSLTVEHTWKINEKHYSFNHFSSRSSNPEDACLWINLIYSTMFLWEYQLKTGNFS